MKRSRAVNMIIILLLAAGILFTADKIISNINGRGWPEKFSDELDAFFGSGSWVCVSEEQKTSSVYTEYSSNDSGSDDVAGKYRNWVLQYVLDDETCTCTITNHTYKINHSRYFFWKSGKRYTAREALIQQLMEVSFDLCEERLYEDLLDLYSEDQVQALTIYVSYTGGNPSPSFYSDLAEQSWFTAQDITAGDFLRTDLYDFTFTVYLYTYRYEQLSESDQDFLYGSMDTMADFFCEKYGEDATFSIYFDTDQQAAYKNGERSDD